MIGLMFHIIFSTCAFLYFSREIRRTQIAVCALARAMELMAHRAREAQEAQEARETARETEWTQ
jgi:hypothetical protein